MAPNEDDVEARAEVKIDDGNDEVAPMKIAPDPGRPTQRQVSEHRVTHYPYRSWCRWCVLGRGRGFHHKKRDGSSIPLIGMDYFFLTKGGARSRRELDYPMDEDGDRALAEACKKGEIVKCLLIRDTLSKAVFAFVVQKKGVDEKDIVADTVLSTINWLGYTRIILKADGEPALQSLVKRVMELAKVECKDLDQMAKEDPVAYDSQSNGGTEVGVRLVRGLLRTVKLCLEQRLDRFIPIDHPVIAWMMEHTCLLINVLAQGEDGLTAWARVRGRQFGQQLVGFGESVLYRYPAKGPHHNPHGNIGALGRDGIFLGYNRTSNTFMIINSDGEMVGARSITRKPESERWDPEALARIQVVPGTGYEQKQRGHVRFQDGATDSGPSTEAVRPAAVRRLRINQSDLDKHGYNEQCPQCKYIRRHGKARAGGFHSEQCRQQLIDKLMQSDEGRARLQGQEERNAQAQEENAARGPERPTPTPVQHDHAGAEPRRFLARAPDAEAENGRSARSEPQASTSTPGASSSDPSGSGARSRVPADETVASKPRVTPPESARVHDEAWSNVQ